MGFPLRWLLFLWSTGSRASVFVSPGLWSTVSADLDALRHGGATCGTSWIRDQTRVSCLFFTTEPPGRRRRWHPTPVLLPAKSHGQRSLIGCSPWGREESDPTERLHFHFSLSCIGEGNGNPLHYSCLENPRDGGAWWAAVSGVAQSRTRLKRLSSSSS